MIEIRIMNVVLELAEHLGEAIADDLGVELGGGEIGDVVVQSDFLAELGFILLGLGRGRTCLSIGYRYAYGKE